MTDNQTKPASDLLGKAEKGEGNYQATRDYNERTERFLEKKGDKVEDLARKAADAVSGPESAELEKAEQDGKAHARD